jgi:hypothetical protein
MARKIDNQQIPVIREKNIISEEISGEYVVYDKLRNRAHHLNQTLSWIWQRCDGTNDIGTLASSFEKHFGVANGTTVIGDALAQLQANGLLEKSVVPESARFVSRRAVMAAGSVAVPAIVSIVAPTPAAAKSKKDKDDDNGKDKDKGKKIKN